jgi:hypothetical protein
MPTIRIHRSPFTLPVSCESALLERFLKAEAMALWAVRSAQQQHLPPHVQLFLRQHEKDEREHLKQFESMIGHLSPGRERLPTVPHQWPVLAVQLYGYESLGLEFATLLAMLRPDLASILKDEETHVAFFEREVMKILGGEAPVAEQAKMSAKAWWRKFPRTVNRYLQGEALMPFKSQLGQRILSAIEQRLAGTGLLVMANARDCAGSWTIGPGQHPSSGISGRVE